MPPTKSEMRTFKVEYRLHGDDAVQTRTVQAAYFKEEDGFVTFKDDANQAVYAVRNDTVVVVERVSPQPQDCMTNSAMAEELHRRFSWTAAQVAEVPEWMLAGLLKEPRA